MVSSSMDRCHTMVTLVTGGAGFVGSHLVDHLVKNGERVIVVDNLSSGEIKFIQKWIDSGDIVFQQCDLKDLEMLKPVMYDPLDGEPVDIVYHLAANPDIRLGTTITDTDLKEGTIATYNVLESMRLAGVKKIAFSSSSVVYGEAKKMPTPENYGPLFPISLYGASKLASEALITSWVGTFGLQAWIFRFANIVGARGTHGVIFDFIHKLHKNRNQLEVLGNGLQEKSYMEVEDCAKSMIYVVENTNEQINCFNLGTNDTCSVRRIAEIVLEESKCQDAEIQYTGGDRGWAGDVPRSMLDPGRLIELGYEPNYSSEEAVRHTARCLVQEIGQP